VSAFRPIRIASPYSPLPSSFEQSQAARARAAAEGNSRPDDLIPIYRKLTTIDSSGRESSTQAKCAIFVLLFAFYLWIAFIW